MFYDLLKKGFWKPCTSFLSIDIVVDSNLHHGYRCYAALFHIEICFHDQTSNPNCARTNALPVSVTWLHRVKSKLVKLPK